jgi:hypothetical protein
MIAIDNWFNSVEAQATIVKSGNYGLGTCKINRKNIPKDAIFKNTGKLKKHKGDMQCMKCTHDGVKND